MMAPVKLMLIVGARPNFVKVAPLARKLSHLSHDKFQTILVHTGQHYDPEMSAAFFTDLAIPEPTYNLEVGSSSHGIQTARIMERFEALCEKENPGCIVVFGDINSTLACALVGAKNHIPVAHVEAGLRSFDRSMPEEINRIVTDVLSDFLFTPDESADENLLKEGIPREKIFRVGDIMVDALMWEKEKAQHSTIQRDLGFEPSQPYGVLTLHRAGNVDDPEVLTHLVRVAVKAAEVCPIVFPVHPRTKKRLKEFHLTGAVGRLYLSDEGKKKRGILAIKPVGHTDFIRLVMDSSFVLTDSGGIQKETTLLGVPCLTLRDTTEWPLTITHGTNTLLGKAPDPERVSETVQRLIEGEEHPPARLPELWDGRTSERIVRILENKLIG